VQISSFWVRGYRGMVDCKIPRFAPVTVVQGDNGTGTSTVVHALRALFGLLAECARTPLSDPTSIRSDRGVGPISEYDRCRLVPADPLVLGARLDTAGAGATRWSVPPAMTAVTVELNYDWQRQVASIIRLAAELNLGDGTAGAGSEERIDLIDLTPIDPGDELLTRLKEARKKAGSLGKRFDHREFFAGELGLDYAGESSYDHWLREFVASLAAGVLLVVDSGCGVAAEPTPMRTGDIRRLLRAGRLQEALLRAGRHPDGAMRRRYRRLRSVLTREPICRPPFELVEDPESGTVVLLEPGPTGESWDIPLAHLGRSVVGSYALASHGILGGAAALAVDTPESDFDRHRVDSLLIPLLNNLVTTGDITQLIVTTRTEMQGFADAVYYRVRRDPGPDGDRVVDTVSTSLPIVVVEG